MSAAETVELTADEVAEIIGAPFEATAQRCHSVSLAIVQSGRFPRARVARGFCRGVLGQHSWVTLGFPYLPGVPIIDATLWSYDSTVEGVWCGRASETGRHVPHGAGSIWDYGQPLAADGAPVDLTPTQPLSAAARAFLELLGPLDRVGWMTLANAPVLGWPAAEIIAAMDDTPAVRALVPIDVLGMITDRNPGGLYLPHPEGDEPPCSSPSASPPR